jgi:hypothetical protein
MRPVREEPVRLSAPTAPASRSAREAAAAIAGPSLRAVLRGDGDGARQIVTGYDCETTDALAAAAERLAAICRGRRP